MSIESWEINCLIWCIAKIDAAKMLCTHMMVFDILHPLFALRFVRSDKSHQPTHPPSIHEAKSNFLNSITVFASFKHKKKKRKKKYSFLQSVFGLNHSRGWNDQNPKLVGCLRFEYEIFFFYKNLCNNNRICYRRHTSFVCMTMVVIVSKT